MELAAKRIVEVCVANGDTWHTEVLSDDMQDSMEQTGLFLLKKHGWVTHGVPVPEFIERVTAGWQDDDSPQAECSFDV